MNSAFTSVSLEEHDHYQHYWQKTPQRSIDYAFANLWGWGNYFGLEWTFDEHLCWLRQTVPPARLWAPVGDWAAVDWSTHPALHKGAKLIRVPETLADILQRALPERVTCTEDRGHWEYLYNTEELTTLPGNRFHKKKNHVNAFRKTYGPMDYRSIDAKTIEDVLALQDEWCQWHECDDSPALRAENEAINRVLSHWEQIPGLVGGTLYVENQLVAFSVGEKLDDATLGVHYEKARNGFRGVYQAMNNAFASEAGQGFALLNRAQDLDEEGLRQAKMSYLPASFLRKFTVQVAPV